MSEAELYGLCAAGLVGIGFYGAILGRSALRRLIAFNLVGSGVFILFGAVARRGGVAASVASDPVPQALVITGLVVAFAATAVAVAVLTRLAATREDAGTELHAERSGERSARATVEPGRSGGSG
jgi:multicomponent Na+:H+ antiporter subunit C